MRNLLRFLPGIDEKTGIMMAGAVMPAVVFLLLPLFGQAQVLSVYDINTGDYPVVGARYMYIDDLGRQVDRMNRDSFQIYENGSRARLLELEFPRKREPRKLSVVLTFDVSSSMDQERLQMAREAALEFVGLLPLDLSECAVSSFDHLNYLNTDFTHSPERIENAIRSLKAKGGTNYNSGFVSPFSGALRIAEKGRHKRVVIFLTDGLGEGDKEHIIRMANDKGITVYPVTIGLKTPQILREIAKKTGGRYFGEVNDAGQARKVYQQILFSAQSVEAGTVKWKSPGGCSDIINTTFDYKGNRYRTIYRLSHKQQNRLDIDPLFVRLDSLDVTDRKEVQIRAVNTDFKIEGLSLSEAGAFTLYPPGTLPFILPKDSTVTLGVGSASGGATSSHASITVNNIPCPDYHIYVKSEDHRGEGVLELVNPNGGEIFTAGMDTTIQWKGLARRDSIFIYHSRDSGRQWALIGGDNGLEHSWPVPSATGNQHLIRIEQGAVAGGAVNLDPLFIPAGQEYKAHSARFINDGQYLVTLEDDHTLKLWNGRTGRFIRSFASHSDWVYDATESPEGEHLVTASDDGSARIMDIESGETLKELRINGWGLNKAIFGRQGRRVITAGDDGAIRIWQPSSGQPLYGILAHSGWVMDIDLHPRKARIVSSGDDNLIRIWDLQSGRHIRTLAGHQNWVYGVEYSPDGSRILSASKDSTFRIWDAQSGKLLHTVRAHRGRVYSAVYNPQGDKILTASRDGTLRIWHAREPEHLYTHRAGEGLWFHRASFGPAGNRIVTTNSRRKVQVWVLNEPEPFHRDISDTTFRIVSPAPRFEAVDFGSVPDGRSKDTLLTQYFRNTGKHHVKVNEIALAGEDRQDFQLISGFQGFVLPPGGAKDLEMSFRPVSIGSKKARLLAVTPTDTLSVPLTGKGLLQRYTIPARLVDMGSVKVGAQKDTSFVLLRNNGNKNLSVSRLQIEAPQPNPFGIEASPDDQTVYPRGKEKIRISFSPGRRGRSHGKVRFRVGRTRHTIELLGTGLASRRVILQGKVLGKQEAKPLPARVACYDLATGRLTDSLHTKSDGSYSLRLNRERQYRLVAEKKGYIPGSIHVDLSQPGVLDTLERNIRLAAIRTGAKVTLNNIFFEYARSRLTETSIGELKRIARFLKENDTLYVELAGHTDSIGTQENNTELSRERADAVRQYLIRSGIEPDRIVARGYGENRPVADNTSPAGRKRNRRVVFTIIHASQNRESE